MRLRKINLFIFSVLFSLGFLLVFIQPAKGQTQTGTLPASLKAGLVSYWRFEDTAGGLTDDTGYNTGSLSGGFARVPGKNGQGIMYTAQTTEQNPTKIPHAPSIMDANKFTISAWIKPSTQTLTLNGNAKRIFNIAGRMWLYLGSDNFFACDVIGGDGHEFFANKDISNGFFKAETWYHTVCVNDGNTLKLYINGNFINQTALTNGYAGSSSPQIGIGIRSDGTEPFLGAIDQVGFWNRALSDSEVSQLYNLDVLVGDINDDGRVDVLDFNRLIKALGQRGSNLPEDLDHSGTVDVLDFNKLITAMGHK